MTNTINGVDGMLQKARSTLDRLDPREAYDAVRHGAVLVDIRPDVYREAEGALPGALVIERNDLEWRFDPTGSARLPIATAELHVIIICNEGYASSLAAGALQALGVHRATDMAGGYRAWRAAGLPVTDPRQSPEGVLPAR